TPFPSTVQVAAQRFLCDVAANYTDLEKEAGELISLHRALGLQRSAFPDSLPALGRAVQEYPEALEFLTHDPQLALFPEMVESAASYADKNQEQWNNLARAVRRFREQARKLGLGDPPTQVAVVCMDGDRMGKLLLHGSPEDPPVCWKHVLHPAVVKKIRSKKRFVDSGWGDLLHLPRLAGPALHAFISRALADFSHTIVPWVVEQEFDGRLIYSGGDDLLAMAPADQALAMADRLRTLYASPWIMDTWPDIAPWSWLEKDQPPQGPEQPGTRFQVIGGNEDLEQYLAELGHDRKPGRLMPMLGPGCTMSAGIMYGHFKTPLGRLLGASHELLDTWAKERAGRNSAGLGHFSRGGVKTMFAAPWDTGSLGLAHTVRLVRDAFAQPGGLPSALPYKLREQRRLLDPFDLERSAGIGEGEMARLMKGLLARAVGDAGVSDASLRAVLDLWKAGHVLKECPDSDDLAGLFFCRYLAARTKGEE
ncbi:MAG TPA: type III-B CRISPR-associated protein Cas10/Cmr2, partial [Desulfobulbus sp.]|nr:type III-B CRISPR-associated protein Cas10/Cmr2 [Desulfobulbus sp.]